MEGAVFITVVLGILLIAVGSLSTTARGFLGFCLYLLIFAFAFVFLRSGAVKTFVVTHKVMINIVALICGVILVGAVVYNLVSSAVKKEKTDNRGNT